MNYTRIVFSVVAMAIVGIIAGITVGVAQTPTGVVNPPRDLELPPDLNPPADRAEAPRDIDPPVFPGNLAPLPKVDPVAQRKIQDALEGRVPEGSSGNVMLDDILNIIQQEGSILDGSVLDPDQDDATKNSEESARAFAAERLLRASRTLEQFGMDDPSRRKLVKQMRSEAGRLLTE